MGDQVLPLPLTERTVHLCVDMQWIFSAEGPWPTPWMDKVLPVAAALANRHPARTVFTRFIPPVRCDQMPGMWQRYHTRWRVATRAPGFPIAGVDATAGGALPAGGGSRLGSQSECGRDSSIA
jgi:nicotinamidase-related amidase